MQSLYNIYHYNIDLDNTHTIFFAMDQNFTQVLLENDHEMDRAV